MSASRIAESRNLPEPFLNKILQALVRAGLVRSARGAGGGFALARSPARISLKEAVEALQGPMAQSGCLLKGAECDYASGCPVNRVWRVVEERQMRTLTEKTLADLLEPSRPACLPSRRPSKRRRGRGHAKE